MKLIDPSSPQFTIGLYRFHPGSPQHFIEFTVKAVSEGQIRHSDHATFLPQFRFINFPYLYMRTSVFKW